ncbi:protein asteroid [Sabethes cyaneus]|uniref:protein asteroid n=1 Tax=Sabethes cyaneus TaxID=53552 RepID=UPI00237DF267|nr:protein asteroid [Sabethes cyaneus]
MGVRGLTTYIAANAERFLEPFELHDCSLVIDGDNLCIQLFVRSEEQFGAFGGNYDHYFRSVVAFFELLAKCNVQPYVLLDGGYEKNKLKTVCSRMLGRIQIIKHVKTISNRPIIPLLIREVFVDALRAMRVPFMRCLFEADNEIAILARKLDCPVLSYDSDFYIHNVKYIPYVTVTHKIYRRVTESEQKYTIELVDRKNKGRDRLLARQGDGDIQPDQIRESYCYLDCSLYTIEQLVGSEQCLKPEMLPLLATLLGNDYIERRVLARFHSTMKVGKVSRKVAPQQRRIVAILKWLKHHSVHSATRAILNQVNDRRRTALTRQLQSAMYGYNCEECVSYEYFGFKNEDTECATDDFLDNLQEESSETMDEPDLVDEEQTQEAEPISETESLDEQNEPEIVEEEAESVKDEEEERDREEQFFIWEPWLLEIYQAGLTPRFVIDLYHSSQYINYPQVENIAKPDSNQICYDILRYIFALLKSSKRGRNFRYLTRCQNVAQYRWERFQDVQLPESVTFDPNRKKNLPLLKAIFEELPNCDEVFLRLQNFPVNYRLYFLCVTNWAFKSSDVSHVHIHTLILCLIQLQYVDKHLTNKSRDQKVFQTNLKTYLEAQKTAFSKNDTKLDLQAHTAETAMQSIKRLTSTVKKPEATLTYEILLPHFTVNERQHRRHAEFDRQVAHTFAELQAVMLNLFTLNALLRHPFEPLRVHEFYNGLFIHNVYQTLRGRSDPLEYIRRTIFRYSPALFALHSMLYHFVLDLVPKLNTIANDSSSSVKVKPKKKSKVSKNRSNGSRKQQDTETDQVAVHSGSEQDEFSDMNNMFNQLLICAE